VVEQARDSAERSKRILKLREEYRERLLGVTRAATAQRLLDLVFARPAVSITGAQQLLDVSYLTASRAVAALAEAGILEEVTGARRGRVFVAQQLVRCIDEPLAIEPEQ
jgi:Fic family protein